MKRLISLAVLLMGCGEHEPMNEIYDSFPTELNAQGQFILNEFITQGESRGLRIETNTLEIKFVESLSVVGTISDATKGVCQKYSDKQVLQLKIDYWERAPQEHQEILMFHELGHCLLNRDEHLDTRNGLNQPTSIMNSSINAISPGYYIQARELYLNELFGSEK